MIRVVLNDVQWQRITPLLPGREGDPGLSGEDNRRLVEAVLWIVCAFGKWGSVWKCSSPLTGEGVFERIFAAVCRRDGG